VHSFIWRVTRGVGVGDCTSRHETCHDDEFTSVSLYMRKEIEATLDKSAAYDCKGTHNPKSSSSDKSRPPVLLRAVSVA